MYICICIYIYICICIYVYVYKEKTKNYYLPLAKNIKVFNEIKGNPFLFFSIIFLGHILTTSS